MQRMLIKAESQN